VPTACAGSVPPPGGRPLDDLDLTRAPRLWSATRCTVSATSRSTPSSRSRWLPERSRSILAMAATVLCFEAPAAAASDGSARERRRRIARGRVRRDQRARKLAAIATGGHPRGSRLRPSAAPSASARSCSRSVRRSSRHRRKTARTSGAHSARRRRRSRPAIRRTTRGTGPGRRRRGGGSRARPHGSAAAVRAGSPASRDAGLARARGHLRRPRLPRVRRSRSRRRLAQLRSAQLPVGHRARGDAGHALREARRTEQRHVAHPHIAGADPADGDRCTLPIYAVMPGRTFRRDTPDARTLARCSTDRGARHRTTGITMGDLMGTIETFIQALFGDDVRTRFLPSFFPLHRARRPSCRSVPVLQAGGCRASAPHRLDRARRLRASSTRNVVDRGRDRSRGVLGLQRYASVSTGSRSCATRSINIQTMLWENDVRFLRQF